MDGCSGRDVSAGGCASTVGSRLLGCPLRGSSCVRLDATAMLRPRGRCWRSALRSSIARAQLGRSFECAAPLFFFDFPLAGAAAALGGATSAAFLWGEGAADLAGLADRAGVGQLEGDAKGSCNSLADISGYCSASYAHLSQWTFKRNRRELHSRPLHPHM